MAWAYNMLAVATLIASNLYVSANSLDIDGQPQVPRPNDENVVFTCAGGNDTKRMSEKMFRMRLMKLDDDDQWTEVAVLRFDGSIDMSDDTATAVGRLGDVLDSHLVVTWPVAPEDINGRYRCDAITLTSTGDVITEQSRNLDVKSMSTDLSLLLERLKKSEKRLLGKVNETIYSALRSSKTKLFSILDSKVEELKEYLDNTTAVSISRREDDMETKRWPAENFTLLMPDAGCPIHPPAWIKSFYKTKAPSGDKYYPIGVPLHLNPHKKDGFIYRQFCTLPASPERTEPWPAGSYCLYSIDWFDRCPTGFKFAQARVKMTSDKGNIFLYYYPKHLQHSSTPFSSAYHEFCCRHDGDASTPIDLPVTHPFYLFRHGGRCQEVKGMDVTQDVFMVETVNEDNSYYDKWFDSNTDFHPDVSFKPYKEELCYYSRKIV